MNKSAPCGCCGTLAACAHCAKLTVIIYSCPPYTVGGFHYAGQAISGCVVHVKNGGVDVTGSPFTTTSSVTPDPQISFDTQPSGGTVDITFTYPSGSIFSAPGSAHTLTINDCTFNQTEYWSVGSASSWSCDCCPSTCCQTDGSSIPIYHSLVAADNFDSGVNFIRSNIGSSWLTSYGDFPSNADNKFTMTCGPSGKMTLRVDNNTGLGETVTGDATPSTCNTFSCTWALDLTATTDLKAYYGNTLNFTASGSTSFGGLWNNESPVTIVPPFCNTSCSGCQNCGMRFPPLQLVDSLYSGTWPLVSNNTATNSTDKITYILNCQTGPPAYYQLTPGWTTGPPHNWTPAGTNPSNHILLSSVNCLDPNMAFSVPQLAGNNPYSASGATITVNTLTSSNANICPDCACTMLDAYSTLHVTDASATVPVTAIKGDSTLGYWVSAAFTVSGTQYEYRFSCGLIPGNANSAVGFYIRILNKSTGKYCDTTSAITTISDCANPNIDFIIPVSVGSPTDCGLFTSGTTLTVAP